MKYFRVFTIAYFLFFVLVILAADLNIIPRALYILYYFPDGDKVGHFVLLGILAFLVNCSLPDRVIQFFSIPLPAGSLSVAFMAVLEEFSQAFFTSRTFSLLDLGSSLLGIILFSYLSMLVIRHIYTPKTIS